MRKYCSVRVEAVETVNTPDGDMDEFITRVFEFDSFAEVVEYLQTTREQQLDVIADSIANGHSSRKDSANYGGFTCELHNRFDGVVEFGLGKEYVLLMRKEPKPLIWYKNGPKCDGFLIFYIDGGHHTQFELHELATRDDGLKKLEQWLNTGEFPQSGTAPHDRYSRHVSGK